MMQITEYTALILIRKNAFYTWLEEAGSKSMEVADSTFKGDHGTYLVKDIITQKDVFEFLEKNYKKLFKNELYEWAEPAYWPKELTRELFFHFFEVQVNRQVYYAP